MSEFNEFSNYDENYYIQPATTTSTVANPNDGTAQPITSNIVPADFSIGNPNATTTATTIDSATQSGLQILQPMMESPSMNPPQYQNLVSLDQMQLGNDILIQDTDQNVETTIEISNDQSSIVMPQASNIVPTTTNYPSEMTNVSVTNILTPIGSISTAVSSSSSSSQIGSQSDNPQSAASSAPDLSMLTDVIMMDDQQQKQMVNSSSQQSQQQQQPSQQANVGTFQAPKTQQIIAGKGQIAYVTTSNANMNQTGTLKFSTSQPQQATQQPIFVNQLIGTSGNTISYILPAGTTFATGPGGKGQQIAIKPGGGGTSTLGQFGGNTLVFNQLPSGSGSLSSTKSSGQQGQLPPTIKLVQTNQGQQYYLTAPPMKQQTQATQAVYGTSGSKPVSIKSNVGTKSTAGGQVQALQIHGQMIPVGPPIQATAVQGQPGTSNQPQSMIILSPVKQGAGGKTGQFAMPSIKLFPQGSSTGKLQQIAPAPNKSGQRIIAPAPSSSASGGKASATASSSTASSTAAGTTIARPIQTIVHSGISGKNIQYISFLPSGQLTGGSGPNPITNIQAPGKLITPAGPNSQGKYVPVKSLVNTSVAKGNQSSTAKPNLVHLTPSGALTLGGAPSTSGAQKVVINPIKIAPGGSVSGAPMKLTAPAGTMAFAGGGKPTSIWMLPKTSMIKVEPNGTSGTFQLQTSKPSSTIPSSKFVPIAPNPGSSANYNATTIKEERINSINTLSKMPSLLTPSDNFNEDSRRKPCNCTRSQCLKLYCDCFANGEFCNNCNCVSCCNNLGQEEIRQKAIRLCLERNPNAFHPKIGQQSQHGDVERKHTKGCNCKRSGCLKNYCECYEAKILCSDKCKCVGCKNFEESTERKTLMHLADAAEFRAVQQAYMSNVQIWGPDLKLKLPVKVKGDTHPFNIFTNDILETTASCLMAQAEEGEFENLPDDQIESLILDQFGECLSQMLNMASNNGMNEDSIEISDDDDDDNHQPGHHQHHSSSKHNASDADYHYELHERT